MPARDPDLRLDSWKEIADYLGKDVRTVVRWEKERGLPVRRLPGGKRQPVFAIAKEIDAWAAQKQSNSGNGTHAAAEPVPADGDAAQVESSSTPFALYTRAAAVAAVLLVALGLWFFIPRSPKGAANDPTAARPPGEEVSIGDGSLRYVRMPIKTGPKPYFFVAADFNGDGNLDLAYSISPASGVGLLLGNGDGTFRPPRIIEGCPQSQGIVVGDFNRDGHPDIAVACFGGNYVLVLWGSNDATFQQREEVPVPGGPRYLAVGDLNGDGWPDLVVGSFAEGALNLLLNRSGTFSTSLIAHFEGVHSLSVQDLNGDGHRDVIVGARDRGKFGMVIFQGSEDGTLKRTQSLTWDQPVYMISAQAVRLGGSRFPDLIYSLENCEVWQRHGLGAGRFSPPEKLVGACQAAAGSFFIVADLDLDGIPDLLVTDLGGSALTFLAGKRNGEFELRGAMAVGDRPTAPVVADFTNDSLPDILENAYFGGAALLRATWRDQTRE